MSVEDSSIEVVEIDSGDSDQKAQKQVPYTKGGEVPCKVVNRYYGADRKEGEETKRKTDDRTDEDSRNGMKPGSSADSTHSFILTRMSECFKEAIVSVNNDFLNKK